MLQHFTVEVMLSSILCFLFTILEWKKLDRKIQQPSTMLTFRNSLLKIGRPAHKPVYNINNPNGLKLFLENGSSYLNKDKLSHNLKDCVNPLFSCSLNVESVPNFFLYCHCFTDIRKNYFMNYNQLTKYFRSS